MNTKNILISVFAILLIGLIFLYQSGFKKANDTPLIVEHEVSATSSESEIVEKIATTTKPIEKKEAKSGLTVTPGVFNYDIIVGKNKCGEKIGTVYITSNIPSEKLYWELDGMKPLWMNVSSVYGETPAQIDLTYNCILSGASSDPYKTAFDVMQTDKNGKPIHKYLFAIVLGGTITLENQ